MGFFESKNEDFIIIAGCGNLGSSLAASMAGQGIVIIDKNKDAFSKLPLTFEGAGIIGDAAEVFIMNNIRIEKAEAVVSTTGNDNTNILIALIAKTCYHTPFVTISLHAPERERVCRELGINIVYPGRVTAKAINDFFHVNVDVR